VIPKYHNQYARFRGFVFFDCDDASLLPWNTTKTAMSMDSPLYKAVRQQMITMMRPVITFLNQLKEEEATAKITGETPLLEQVDEAKPVVLRKLSTADTFRAPKVSAIRTVQPGTLISYRKVHCHLSWIFRRICLVANCRRAAQRRQIPSLHCARSELTV
jgi:hypothetical protein